jgi:hypothetical protein
LERLASITEQANDLQGLLFGAAELPGRLSDEAVRLISRLSDGLSELVQRIGEAGPEGVNSEMRAGTDGQVRPDMIGRNRQHYRQGDRSPGLSDTPSFLFIPAVLPGRPS